MDSGNSDASKVTHLLNWLTAKKTNRNRNIAAGLKRHLPQRLLPASAKNTIQDLRAAYEAEQIEALVMGGCDMRAAYQTLVARIGMAFNV